MIAIFFNFVFMIAIFFNFVFMIIHSSRRAI